jgi:Mannosyl-glycoprotein endo-beta-N-acetylglucosaminidase
VFNLTGAAAGRVAFTALAAVVVVAGVLAPARGAAEAPADPLDPAAPATAVDLVRANREFERADRQLAVVRQRLAFAQGLLADTTNQLAVNTARLADVRQRVRERAAAVYQRSGSGNLEELNVPSVGDLDSGSAYAEAALSVDDTQLRTLSGVVGALQQVHEQQSQGASDLEQSQTDLQQSEQALAERRTRDHALLDRWGAVPVMGQPTLSGPQLAAWFTSTGAVPRLAPGTTIDDVAQLYIVEGGQEGVRGDIAFAQAIIETGYFSVAAGNNYAGIGVCDSCTGGYRFPTPLDGVRAQIQLLRNYADPDSRAAKLANPPEPGLYGPDPRKAASLYDSFSLKGRAPLWNQMGHGNWATDPTYAAKVTGLFRKMLAFASSSPAA